jgi:N-acetylglucosaminyldiphosphoundecaprenol N-acetyl-beta-D-mannosaminyltransferase
MVSSCLPQVQVVESPITALPFDSQMQVILSWAKERTSKFVCVANTHMLVEAHQSPRFKDVLYLADLVTPDGMPLVWMMKLLGVHNQNRVAGIDIFETLCKESSLQSLSIFFVGSQGDILNRIRLRLAEEFPDLRIAGMESMPFRPLTRQDDESILKKIKASGASIVFVSLGCPKQERWMAQHRGRLPAVMIGLGGVFPVYAGIQKRAPQWAREHGLEWLYRLVQEPRRLWKRYGSTIPLFVFLAARQLFQHEGSMSLRSRVSKIS